MSLNRTITALVVAVAVLAGLGAYLNFAEASSMRGKTVVALQCDGTSFELNAGPVHAGQVLLTDLRVRTQRPKDVRVTITNNGRTVYDSVLNKGRAMHGVYVYKIDRTVERNSHFKLHVATTSKGNRCATSRTGVARG